MMSQKTRYDSLGGHDPRLAKYIPNSTRRSEVNPLIKMPKQDPKQTLSSENTASKYHSRLTKQHNDIF